MAVDAPRVAYVTYCGEDDEADRTLQAWSRAGLDSTTVPWDSTTADWASFDAAVVRSVWDYTSRYREFLAWASRVSQQTRLLNSFDTLQRNISKTYLRDLAASGIPIVPTQWFPPHENVPSELMRQAFSRWAPSEIVVKPTISAGARNTIRTGDLSTAVVHANRLTDVGLGVMAQPYLKSLETCGETSLIYFGKEYSHSVRRGAMLIPEATHSRWQVSPRTPSAAQLQLGGRTLAVISAHHSPLFARVDIAQTDHGEPVLMELEMIEPCLFLSFHPPAAERFAAALADRLARKEPS